MSKINKESGGVETAFLDLLFTVALLFAVLVILMVKFINPEVVNEKNVEAKAEAIITVTWPEEANDDVDSYLEDPTEAVIWFGDKDQNFMNLDRDDRGVGFDTVITEFGQFNYPENKEILTIRKLMDGEYVFWVHMYRMKSLSPITINVVMEKINPSVQLLQRKEITLSGDGDHTTAFRFVVKDGEIVSFSDLQKKFPPKNKRNSVYAGEQRQ
jgi:hypothetical protein